MEPPPRAGEGFAAPAANGSLGGQTVNPAEVRGLDRHHPPRRRCGRLVTHGSAPERLLVRALLSLKDDEECRAFLEDIATVTEVQALAHRLAVARLLLEGRTYQEVVAETGASTATVSRVKRALYFGRSAMRAVLERIMAEERAGVQGRGT
jgi:TrpR-related protein YerC/YecD